MKFVFIIFFVTLVTFSGNPNMIAQQPIPAKFKSIVEPIRISNDSLEKRYYIEIKKTEKLTDQLIAKKKDVDAKNLLLSAEIKRLRKVNELLRNTIDTVHIHDTVFKKRKFLQLFKN